MHRALLFLALLLTVGGTARAEDDEAQPDVDTTSPLDADRDRELTSPLERGLWLSLSGEGGVLARDPHAGLGVGVGFEHPLVALHLRAPLHVRVVDLEPVAPRSAYPLCDHVRCVEWTREGRFDPWSLARLVDTFRVGRPGDLFHVEGGPLRASLGSGQLIDGLINSPVWDARRAGVFARAALPDDALFAEVFLADVTAPWSLGGTRVGSRPFVPFALPGSEWGRFLSRAEISLELAGDLAVAETVRPFSSTAEPFAAFSRPLVGLALDARWALLPSGLFAQLTPFVSSSILHGLSATGLGPAELGAGAAAGAQLDLRVPFVGLSVEGQLTFDGPAHRSGVFGPLYLVEERVALAGASKPGASVLSVPAPMGSGAEGSVVLSVTDHARAGVRARVGPAPGANTAEAFVDATLLGADLGGSVIVRGLGEHWRAPSSGDLAGLDRRTYAALQLSVPVYGPFSVYARALHGPRVDERNGALRFDTDVMVGVDASLVLDSPAFRWF